MSPQRVEHQVGVVAARRRIERGQQLVGRVEGHVEGGAAVSDVQPGGRAQRRVNVGGHLQDAQRRLRRVQLPGVIERRDGGHAPGGVARRGSGPQKRQRGGIAQRQGDVGVVVLQFGRTGQQAVEEGCGGR